jgi:hypothetical protein
MEKVQAGGGDRRNHQASNTKMGKIENTKSYSWLLVRIRWSGIRDMLNLGYEHSCLELLVDLFASFVFAPLQYTGSHFLYVDLDLE